MGTIATVKTTGKYHQYVFMYTENFQIIERSYSNIFQTYIIGTTTKDELWLELEKYKLTDIYDALRKESITAYILWDLTEDEIRQIGLNVGQRHRYFRAKDLYKDSLPTTTMPTSMISY